MVTKETGISSPGQSQGRILAPRSLWWCCMVETQLHTEWLGCPQGRGRTSQRYPNLAVPGMSSEWVISCYELSPRISINFWKTWTKAGGPEWAQIEHTNTAFDRLCCCSVAQSCPALWDPMDWSTAGLSIPHHLPEFAQVYVHWWASPIAHW